ncbi:MAG: DsbA family protein [Gemmatimonadaceae bacterium]
MSPSLSSSMLALALLSGALSLATGCRRPEGGKSDASTASTSTPASPVSPSSAPPSPAAGGNGSGSARAVAPPTDSLSSRADRARIQGNPSAKVWVVEVSDFQCPFCRNWHEETYGQLKKEYIDSGKIRFAYINLPLPMHQHAREAANAAMCAAAQGRFWPMHDALFVSQLRWEKATEVAGIFDSLAVASGVTAAPYRACVRASSLAPLIEADYDRAVKAGVNSTPTFLVGDQLIEGAQPIENFRKVIDAALAKVTGTGSSGH